MNGNTGGPVFPKLTQDERYKTFQSTEGMTMRDYFAAKAMQGAIANMSAEADFSSLGAEWAYKIADLMLKAREA